MNKIIWELREEEINKMTSMHPELEHYEIIDLIISNKYNNIDKESFDMDYIIKPAKIEEPEKKRVLDIIERAFSYHPYPSSISSYYKIGTQEWNNLRDELLK